jgi:hypothetical protein
MTPEDLLDALASLGIKRSPRVLTDWRSSGLLPPLKRVGQGRGKGAKHVWEQPVLDRAVAADWLMDRFGETDEGRR